MTIETMTRKAADNRYFHRDFHNILNHGLDYLRQRFGAAGVAEYLADFADACYAPLTDRIRAEGLSAVKARFRQLFVDEGAESDLSFEESPGALTVRIARSPAVAHIRESGFDPSPLYSLTTTVVWRTIAERGGIGFEPLALDPKDGSAVLLFYVKHGEKSSETKEIP